MTMQWTMSVLPKTWIFDLDGTLVEHNGYLHGGDKLLPGVKEFWERIPVTDFILILTSRKKEEQRVTEQFLADHQIRFNQIIYDLPMGERILINDDKPSGLPMAFSVRRKRNEGLGDIIVHTDDTL